ncbi:MAG: amidohydrolase [Candidatus Heimdallarchaeota archaeon]|nr:amidohydrolase [Candidatus Heimdallarchaeota archaeon]
MEDLVLTAGWSYSEGRIIKNPQIIIEDGKITYHGAQSGSETPSGIEKRSYPKGLILPPFINSHTHISETLIRGICDDADLHEWLYDHVWKVEPKMNSNDAKIGAQLAAAEMLSSGTIAFVDQYFFADQIASMVEETGMKALLSPSIFDGNPETIEIEKSFQQNLKVLNKWHKKDDRIFVGFGPHAPYSVSDDYYQRIYEKATEYDTKIHTHLSETAREVEESLESNGLSPIEKMNKLGVLDRIVAAHCIHLSENDKRLLYENKVDVLHCPQSNLKIGAGIADITNLLDRGINVCLGTDGNASNNNLEMLEEVRLSALIHRGIHHDPKKMNTQTALKLATENPTKIFPKGVLSGNLDEGSNADILLVDLNRIHTTPIINPLSNWIYSGNNQNVALTICNGKILYDEGSFPTLDIDTIMSKAQESTNRMMSEANYISNSM